MSRKKHKRKEFRDGDPCDRRKPCPGAFRLDSRRDGGGMFIWERWRCDTCGKKRGQMLKKPPQEPSDD